MCGRSHQYILLQPNCTEVNTVSFIPFLQTFPSPPETELFSIESDCCSANVSWPLPPNEVEGTISYNIQQTSSCSNNNLVMNITSRWYLFTNLCADVQYSLAIQVTLVSKNITGVYSEPFVFRTESGTPSEVQYIQPFVQFEKNLIIQLTITWSVPQKRNGSIIFYDIRWSNSSVDTDCDTPDGIVLSQNISDSTLELKTDDVANIVSTKTLLICIRAYTRTHAGLWGLYRTADTSVGKLTSDTCSEPCPSLITVAIIASVAVLSSTILGVILVIVLFYNRWTLFKQAKSLREGAFEQKPDDSKSSKMYHKSLSMQSNSSTAPMLNGT